MIARGATSLARFVGAMKPPALGMVTSLLWGFDETQRDAAAAVLRDCLKTWNEDLDELPSFWQVIEYDVNK